ncbi:hypothetical protein [Shimazuella alba]|uniref:Uncharacterized protein n=1 Tax=Shimazuella alba TaxID=2690964 RepID=A0A6I4VTI3_9BACL|nr:hypothetical protein [Shimazuella alba]MXQ53808.1 hypothetical protein [Shimazuella alba]
MFAKISSVLRRVENHTNTENSLFKWLLPMILVIAGSYNWFSTIGWGSTVGIITVSLLTFAVKENRLTHMGQLGTAYGMGWLTFNVAAPLVLIDGWQRPIIAVLAAFYLSIKLSNWMDHRLKYAGVATSAMGAIMLICHLFSVVEFTSRDITMLFIYGVTVAGLLIYITRLKSNQSNAASAATTPVTKAASAATTPVTKAASAAMTPVTKAASAATTPVTKAASAAKAPVTKAASAATTPVTKAASAATGRSRKRTRGGSTTR